MKLDDYQYEASKTAIYPKLGHTVVYPALGLAGEAGEVAEKVKKMCRDEYCRLTPAKAAEIAKELGDVLWYVSACATEIGYTLSEVAALNIEKLESRKTRGALGGSGDNR